MEKFASAVKKVNSSRLSFEKLIGRTKLSLDGLAEKHSKNTPASPDSWMDNTDPDSAPIVE